MVSRAMHATHKVVRLTARPMPGLSVPFMFCSFLRECERAPTTASTIEPRAAFKRRMHVPQSPPKSNPM